MHPTVPRTALAGVIGFGVIAVAGMAWPRPTKSETVTFRLQPAGHTITAGHRVKPVFQGESVAVYQGSKTIAKGRLDANATATFKLEPASYVFCVRLPAGVTVPGASERGGLRCEPVQTGNHLTVVTFEYHQGGRS